MESQLAAPVPAIAPKKNRNVEAFGAIVSFVNDLWEVFGSDKVITPLALYNRLVQKITFSDATSVQKAVHGFETFFKAYGAAVVSGDLESIPRDTIIAYGDNQKIGLEIQKYIHLSRNDSATKETIRQHLLTISAIIEPSKAKIEELGKRSEIAIDTSTKEGQFIDSILNKAKSAAEDIQTDDPMQAMMGIVRSGVLQDMITGLKQGVDGEGMDMQKLLGTMQSAIGSLTSEASTRARQSSQQTIQPKTSESKIPEPETD